MREGSGGMKENKQTNKPSNQGTLLCRQSGAQNRCHSSLSPPHVRRGGILRLLQQTLFSALESTPSHASWLGLIFKHENDCPELTFSRIQRGLWLLTEIVRPCSSQLALLILPQDN